MNISRIALLSAVLFIAPFAIASEESTANTILITTPDAKPGFFTKAGNFVAAPFVFAGSSVLGGAGWIANKSYLNDIISKITAIGCLKETRLNKPESIQAIGKTIVIVAGLAAAYKMYTICNTEDVDNDEDIFGDDEYEMNS